MILGRIEALPIECRETRRHRLVPGGVSECEGHPQSIGNGNFKLGQYPAAEVGSPSLYTAISNPSDERGRNHRVCSAFIDLPSWNALI